MIKKMKKKKPGPIGKYCKDIRCQFTDKEAQMDHKYPQKYSVWLLNGKMNIQTLENIYKIQTNLFPYSGGRITNFAE